MKRRENILHLVVVNEEKDFINYCKKNNLKTVFPVLHMDCFHTAKTAGNEYQRLYPTWGVKIHRLNMREKVID